MFTALCKNARVIDSCVGEYYSIALYSNKISVSDTPNAVVKREHKNKNFAGRTTDHYARSRGFDGDENPLSKDDMGCVVVEHKVKTSLSHVSGFI